MAIVRDIMKRPVIFARDTMTLRELMDLLRDHRISGVPVLDDELRLVGVVSETDLIRLDLPSEAEPQDILTLGEDEISVRRTYRMERLDKPVSEVMTREVVTCTPTDDVRSLCRLFIDHRIHRIVVMEKGEVAGIVTPLDVMGALAADKLTSPAVG